MHTFANSEDPVEMPQKIAFLFAKRNCFKTGEFLSPDWPNLSS